MNLEELVEDDALLKKIDKNSADLAILVDRLISKADDEETQFRLGDSVQTAYFEGEGICWVELEGQKRKIFSDRSTIGELWHYGYEGDQTAMFMRIVEGEALPDVAE